MAVYPSVNILEPMEETIEFDTKITTTKSGIEYRRSMRARPIYSVSVRHDKLTDATIDTLYNFYVARKGAYDPFMFLYPSSLVREKYYLGIGNGVTTTFKAPFKYNETTTFSLYKVSPENVTYEIASADYTITEGTDNVATVVLDSPMTANWVVVANITSKPYIKMRFSEDSLTRQYFSALISSVGIKLRQVLE